MKDLNAEQSRRPMADHRRKKLLMNLGMFAAVALAGVAGTWVLENTSFACGQLMAASSSATVEEPEENLTSEQLRQRRIEQRRKEAEEARAQALKADEERRAELRRRADERRAEADKRIAEEMALREKELELEKARLEKEQQQKAQREKERDATADKNASILRARAQEQWIESSAYTAEYFLEKVAAVYDGAEFSKSTLAGYCGGGVIAELGEKLYFFTPVSVLFRATEPMVILSNGETVDLTRRDALLFGAADVCAFYLEQAPKLTDEQKQIMQSAPPAEAFKLVMNTVPIEKHPEVQGMRTGAIVGPNRTVPGQISQYRSTIEFYGGTSWRLRSRQNDDISGMGLFDSRTAVFLGVVSRGFDGLGEEYGFYRAADLSMIGGGMPVLWDDLISDIKNFKTFHARTRSLLAVSRKAMKDNDLPDYAVRSLVDGARKRIKEAQARKTSNLKDTSKIMERFRDDVDRLASAEDDLLLFKTPFFRAQVQEGIQLRKKCAKDIHIRVRDIDISPL